MRDLVEFPLTGGGSVLVLVDAGSGEDGVVRASRPGEVVARAQHTFEEAISAIRPVAEHLVRQLSDLPSRPREIAVEFHVGMSAKAQAFVASAGSEGHFKVTLRWMLPERAADVPAGPSP